MTNSKDLPLHKCVSKRPWNFWYMKSPWTLARIIGDFGFCWTFWDVRPSTAHNLSSHPKKRISKWELMVWYASVCIYIYIYIKSISNLGALFKVQGSPLHWFINHSFHIQNFPVSTPSLSENRDRLRPPSRAESRNFVTDQSCTRHPCGWCWSPSRHDEGNSPDRIITRVIRKKSQVKRTGWAFRNFFQWQQKNRLDMRKPARHQFFLTCHFFHGKTSGLLALWITS